MITLKDPLKPIIHNHRVIVHVNLKNGLFSIKDAKTRRILGHGSNFLLKDCSMHFNRSEQAKAVRDHLKNVHATITGTIQLEEIDQCEILECQNQLTYCPFKNLTFVDKMTNQEVSHADFVYFSHSEINKHYVTYKNSAI